MSSLLGLRITRNDGVGGVVVNASFDSTWRSSSMAHCYDIVWSDGESARKVTPEALSSQGWKLSTDRVDPLECNRLWMQHTVDRCAKMAEAALERSRSAAVVHPTFRANVSSGAVHVAPPFNPAMVAPDAGQAVERPKPVSAQAKAMLESAIPGVTFSVVVERKRLSVAWIDGPAAPAVEKAIAPLFHQGAVLSTNVRRGASLSLVQAAIDHVLDRLWAGSESPDAVADRMRLTPEDFQSNFMATIFTPPSSVMGSTPYNTLIRCVIDRWDDCVGRFVETSRTKHLVQERAFLFPLGDDFESSGFSNLLEGARCAREDARDYVNTLSTPDRQRG